MCLLHIFHPLPLVIAIRQHNCPLPALKSQYLLLAPGPLTRLRLEKEASAEQAPIPHSEDRYFPIENSEFQDTEDGWGRIDEGGDIVEEEGRIRCQ